MTIIYIIGAILLLPFVLQFFLLRSARKSQGKRLSGLKGGLSELERPGSKGLVYFHSPGCRACSGITPVIKHMQSQHKKIFDVDVSKDMGTAALFGIKATPTIMVLENGIVKNVYLGARPKSFVESLITW